MIHLLATLLGPQGNFVDIGCYRGAILAEALKIAPQGRHIAFEPLPPYAAQVANRFPGVEVKNIALSNEPGEKDFFYVRSRPALSGFHPPHGHEDEDIQVISVCVERLDECLPRDYVPTVIKIDVEGAQQQVIEGGMATIRRHKPVVLFEHGRSTATGASTTHSDDIYVLLTVEAGLEVRDLRGGGPFSANAFTHAVEHGVSNFVAAPANSRK